jgi:ligand-binding sensor domain-containing protein
VRALLATGDTLWMGTDAGLLLLPPGERSTPVRSTLQQEDARLGGQVRAIATSDSVVVIGLGVGDVVRIDRRSGRLLPRAGAGDVTLAGPVLALAMDARSLFVVGTRGVVAVDRDGGSTRYLSLRELGGEAYDVVLSPDAAWVATRAGVVRLSRRAGGLPR